MLEPALTSQESNGGVRFTVQRSAMVVAGGINSRRHKQRADAMNSKVRRSQRQGRPAGAIAAVAGAGSANCGDDGGIVALVRRHVR